jgi:hypothetical protein
MYPTRLMINSAGGGLAHTVRDLTPIDKLQPHERFVVNHPRWKVEARCANRARRVLCGGALSNECPYRDR